MQKKYVGYFEIDDLEPQSGLFAEINWDKATEEDRDFYDAYKEDPKENAAAGNFLSQSIYPTMVYYGIGFDIPAPDEAAIIINQTIKDEWPTYIANIYDTKEEARAAFFKELAPHKAAIIKEIFKVELHFKER